MKSVYKALGFVLVILASLGLYHVPHAMFYEDPELLFRSVMHANGVDNSA